jgi:uncharacterized protein with NRDE domain
MCTLIVLDRVLPGLPVVAASNRDEFFSRPAAPPARVEPQEEDIPAFVAPQDLEAGGTWMGLNARGLFVGLTNRRTPAPQKNRRSRGLLVTEALRRSNAGAVAQDMRQGLEGTYNPFHLLYTDGRQTFLTRLDERSAQKAVAQIDLDAPFSRVFDGLAGILAQHGAGDPLEHTCVHTPEYGTRSSAILALGEERWRYWHAEGPPCQAKFRNFTRLLDDLRRRSVREERT